MVISITFTRELFDQDKILELVELTLDILAFDPILFSIALCFWTSDYNTFVFPLGPMSVTLRDISLLTNLLPIGATISPAMVVIHIPPSIEKHFFGFYKQLLTLREAWPPSKTNYDLLLLLLVVDPFGSPNYGLGCIFSILPIILDSPAIPAIEEPQSSKLSTQMADRSPSSSIKETPVEIPIVEEPSCPVDKGKAPTSFESQSQADILPNLSRDVPLLPKASDESIQALFTSWEQVQASSITRASSATRHSTSSILSTEDMDVLKRAMLAYTSFMDEDISRVSANSKKELLACLSKDLAATLKCPTLELSASTRLTLREIHQKVSILLSMNVELRAKKTSFIQTLAEKESLNININSAKSKLN
ncbi:Aminotransferase-like [Abeliophyllum distichum]|uniref:Aminotransferase-like n=1 Tax=Abeliophyllum distichum TaxID=126358 RepID=A0ABD1PPR8_9LAMI